MKEIFQIGLAFVVVIFLLFGSLFSIIAFIEYNTCKTLVQVSDFDYQWFAFGGCRVLSQEGYWVYYNDVFITDGQVELKGDK